MNSTIDDVIVRLDNFAATGEEHEDIQRLDEITVGLATSPGAATAIPALFRVLERHANCDLGLPGPVVHTIEEIGGHIPELLKSLERTPTDLTIWMVNRLLNSDLDRATRGTLLEQLREIAENVSVAEELRQSAGRFLDIQSSEHNSDGTTDN